MKRIIITTILVFFSVVKGTSQINNLKDLLEISELNVEEMVSELQYSWKLNPPEQDTSEKGYITERYIFSYDRDNIKQVLKKCGRMDLSTRQTIWLTNFVSNDKNLLDRITKNLTYQGFELKGKLKSNSMYDDGNRTVSIQTESESDYKMPKGCYSIYVVVNNNTLENVLNNSLTEKENNSKKLFNGKKKFCDGVKAWYYIVRIESDNITLELYPDLENNLHKNKTKPFEIIKGKIIGNVIKVPFPKDCQDCDESLKTKRFKIDNNILYEANYEDGYNKYVECDKKKETNSSKDVLANILNSSNNNGTGNGKEVNTFNNRKIIEKPSPEYKCNEEGKVVVQVTINKQGMVIDARAGFKGTTNASKCLLGASKEAALNTKWEVDENAPEKQIGTISYNFKIK